jgi:hypothetical protein
LYPGTKLRYSCSRAVGDLDDRWRLGICLVGGFGGANSLSPSDAEAGYSSVPKALPFMRQLGRHEDGQSANTVTMAV